MNEEEETVRAKQELLLETIKQMIAIKKLMKRNYLRSVKEYGSSNLKEQKQRKPEVANSGQPTPIKSEHGEKLTSAEDHSLTSQNSQNAVDKIHLPIIFVQV